MAWHVESLTKGHSQTKKGKKRGEIFQIRSAMCMKYPGWHTNLNTINAALRTKPEWAVWTRVLNGERSKKLKKNREKKKERREHAEKKGKTKWRT